MTKCLGGLAGHHRVVVMRVPVEKRRMMHRRLVERAGWGILTGASLVDAYRLSEARRCRRGRRHSLGSVPSTSLIDTHGDGKAGRGGPPIEQETPGGPPMAQENPGLCAAT